MCIVRFKMYLNRLNRMGNEQVTRFNSLSMNEQDMEINNYFGKV